MSNRWHHCTYHNKSHLHDSGCEKKFGKNRENEKDRPDMVEEKFCDISCNTFLEKVFLETC